MKKILIIASMAAVMAGVVLASCKKEDVAVVKIRKTNETIAVGVSMADIEYVCSKHNQYLDEIFAEFNFEATDYAVELQRCIQMGNFDNISAGIKDSLCEIIANADVTQSAADNLCYMIDISAILGNKSCVLSLLSAIDSNAFIADYSNVYHITDSLKNAAYSSLNGIDLLLTLSYFEMVCYSAYYWMPVVQGGSGYGDDILCYGITHGDTAQASQTAKEIAEVVAADCATASGSFLTVALMGPATVAGLAGVAVGSAMSSAYTALLLNLKKKQS